MKAIFNDGREMTIQAAAVTSDGALEIKTISATDQEIRDICGDDFAVKQITIREREQDVAVYEGYTEFDAIKKYTAGIVGIILYKEGQSQSERIEVLEKEAKEAKDNLAEAIVEMTQTIAGLTEALAAVTGGVSDV